MSKNPPKNSNKKIPVLKIITAITGFLVAITSFIGLFIIKQQNQISILKQKIEIRDDSIKQPNNEINYENEIKNINIKLNNLSAKDSTLEEKIISLSNSLTDIKRMISIKQPPTDTISSGFINPVELPIINDTLFSVNNPYPKYFNEVKIDDNKAKIDKSYHSKNVLQTILSTGDVQVKLNFTPAIFTYIYYRCRRNNDNRYIIHSIEYFFNETMLDYIRSHCINTFGENPISNIKGYPYEEWTLNNGLKVRIKTYSKSTHSYIISRD